MGMKSHSSDLSSNHLSHLFPNQLRRVEKYRSAQVNTPVMISLRFPFCSFPPPGNSNTRRPSISPTKVAFAAGVACAVAAGGIVIAKPSDRHPIVETTLDFILSHIPLNSNSSSSTSPFWASLSLSSDATPIVESKTGASFPPVLKDSQTLLGLGLRRKSIFGIKNIDVYAFSMP